MTTPAARLAAELDRARQDLARYDLVVVPAGDDVERSVLSEARELIARHRGAVLGRITDLSEALRKIEAGEAFLCTGCGESISPARLAALPTADRCVACQAIHERESGAEPEPVGIRRVHRPTKPIEELG